MTLNPENTEGDRSEYRGDWGSTSEVAFRSWGPDAVSLQLSRSQQLSNPKICRRCTDYRSRPCARSVLVNICETFFLI